MRQLFNEKMRIRGELLISVFAKLGAPSTLSLPPTGLLPGGRPLGPRAALPGGHGGQAAARPAAHHPLPARAHARGGGRWVFLGLWGRFGDVVVFVFYPAFNCLFN